MHHSCSSGTLNSVWDDSQPHEYLWKTSIPSKWIKLKGSEFFKPANLVKRTDGALDNMHRTQKHIAKGETTILKRRVMRKWESQDQDALPRHQRLQKKSAKASIVTLECSDIVEPHPPQALFLEKLPKSRSKPPPEAKTSSYQITTLLLNPYDKELFKSYVINKYARPNGLIPVQRVKSEEELHVQQSQEVKQFLKRFDSKQLPALPPRARKGFNGWKLTKAKSGNQSTTFVSEEDEQVLDTRENASVERVDRPPGEEPYIEYIRWKRKNSDDK